MQPLFVAANTNESPEQNAQSRFGQQFIACLGFHASNPCFGQDSREDGSQESDYTPIVHVLRRTIDCTSNMCVRTCKSSYRQFWFLRTQEDPLNADVLTTKVADGIAVVTLGSARRIYFDEEMGDALTEALMNLAE